MTLIIKSTYWIASHITGIFEIFKDLSDLLLQGSKGAGFCINRGVKTTVFRDINQKKLRISFNNELIEENQGEVSKYILSNLVSSKDVKNLIINHTFEVPLGAGYGASAAGALGLAYAINSLFNLNKRELDLWYLAHKAEIVCNAGLGDILGLFQGGTEIRVKPGAPNIGRTTAFQTVNKKNNLVTISLGGISTKNIITSIEKQKKISETASELLKKINSQTSFSEFLALSSEFTRDIQLYSSKLKNLMDELAVVGIPSAQIMLGDGLFFEYPKRKNLTKILNDLGLSKEQCFIETICSKTVKKMDL